MAEGRMNPPPPRTQPPPPVFSPPVNSYRSARREELDALRQKGLTKIFNKHFTSVADKIRQEREAAELALAEIIKRKAELAANPKSFKEGGLTLTQLDKLHMELQKRKNEVQRKERETQELYKRYCSQYGENEHDFADVANWKNATEIIGQHDYNPADLVRQQDLTSRKTTGENGSTDGVNVNKLTANIEEKENQQLILPSSNTDVGKLSNQGPSQSDSAPDAIAPSAKLTPTKLQLNSSGLDQTAASTPSPSPVEIKDSPSVFGAASVMDRSLYFARFHDDDDDSAVSGLTDIDGATVAEAEWKLTEFLRTETENIKKMLTKEPEFSPVHEDDNYSIFTYNRSLVSGESDRVGKAAREAEEMVAKMAEATAWMNDPTLLEEDSDSEDEEEKPEWVAFWSEDHKREYFYNTITHQTCWTKPQSVEIDFSHAIEQKKSKKSSSNNSVHSHSKSQASSTEKDSTSIKRNVHFDSPAKSTISKIESPLSDEKVAVKDFTKKGPSPEAMHLSRSTNNHMIKSFQDDSGSAMSPSINSMGTSSVRSTTKTSKVMQYRRKRARIAKRNRRIAIVSVAVAVFAFIILKNQWFSSSPAQTSSPEIDEAKREAEAAKKLELAKKLAAAEAAKAERKRILEEQRKEQELRIAQEKKKAEEARLAQEARKAAEEKKLKEEQEQQRKLKEQEDKKRQEELQVMMRLEEEAMQLQLQEDMKRPWACNIPFTYIMSRKCWKVSKLNPIYDVEYITDAMMQ